MNAEQLAESDRLTRAIDRARQEQAAHAAGCYDPDCAECTRLQRRLDALYRAHANCLLAEESGEGGGSGS